jgi:hypothetical protein
VASAVGIDATTRARMLRIRSESPSNSRWARSSDTVTPADTLGAVRGGGCSCTDPPASTPHFNLMLLLLLLLLAVGDAVIPPPSPPSSSFSAVASSPPAAVLAPQGTLLCFS